MTHLTDLTKITTPFGLLDPETQEALKAHGGPYEAYLSSFGLGKGVWNPVGMGWPDALTVRVKPAPPKPREWWLFWSQQKREWLCSTERDFAVREHGNPGVPVIHVREVLP